MTFRLVALDRLAGSPFDGMPGVSVADIDPALTGGRASAWGAVRSGTPIGVACAVWARDADVAELVTCYVRPRMRRQGAATALLARLQRSVEVRGHRRIWCRYLDDPASSAPLEALLRRAGWDPPAHLITHVRAEVGDLARAPWLRFTELPAGLECEPWNTVTARELARLLDEQRSDPWIPTELAPWRAGIDAPGFDAEQSVVLRDEGGVRGWLLAVRTAPTTAHVGSAWIHPALQRRPPVPPLVPMCARAVAVGAERGYRTVTWSIHRSQPRMAAFNRRHLRPYISGLTHERVSGRDFGTGGGRPDPGDGRRG